MAELSPSEKVVRRVLDSIQPRERVRVRSGPWRGCSGVIMAHTANGRVLARLNSGRGVRAFDSGELESRVTR